MACKSGTPQNPSGANTERENVQTLHPSTLIDTRLWTNSPLVDNLGQGWEGRGVVAKQ